MFKIMMDLAELIALALKSPNRAARTIGLASAIRSVGPGATALVCSVYDESNQSGEVFDHEGRRRPEWSEALAAANDLSSPHVLPPTADGMEFIACAIRFSQREFGRIALASPNSD